MKKLVSIIGAGILALTSCSNRTLAEKPSNSEEKQVVKELKSLGYIEDESEKTKIKKELKSLGYIDDEKEKVETELKSLGYLK